MTKRGNTLGLTVRTRIDDNNGITIIEENKTFNNGDLNVYKNDFRKMLNDGIIINKNFDDSQWKLKDFSHIWTFDFDFKLNPEINNALKAFTIINIYNKKSEQSSVNINHKSIIDAINSTRFFDIEYLNDYVDYLMYDLEFSARNSKVIALTKFLEFYKTDYSNEYISVLHPLLSNEENSRRLAHYTSIIEFDIIIHKFMSNASEKELKTYFPLFLWWRFTNIIPTRPIEFTLLKRDCLVKKNGGFYIKIHRKKHGKRFVKQSIIKPLSEIKIDKKMYSYMLMYQNMVSYNENDRFFLSYKTYNELLKEGLNESAMNKKIEKDYLGTSQLRALLDKFYNNIVSKEYTVCEKGTIKDDDKVITSNLIEKIALGDTRHFAFINMILQGFNPLTIAQIGGHRTLQEQEGYYNHPETLIKANTYVLTKKILENFDNRSEIINNFFNPREMIRKQKINIEKHKKQGKTPRNVEYGLCWNEKAPEEDCVHDDCFYCTEYFEFNLSDPYKRDKLLKSLETNNQNNINTLINTLKKIALNMNIDTKFETYSLEDQNSLDTISKDFQTLIAKEAILKSYKHRMEVIKFEQ